MIEKKLKNILWVNSIGLLFLIIFILIGFYLINRPYSNGHGTGGPGIIIPYLLLFFSFLYTLFFLTWNTKIFNAVFYKKMVNALNYNKSCVILFLGIIIPYLIILIFVFKVVFEKPD